MPSPLALFWTTVGRKIITALFGLALIGFVVTHLAGNLTLFIGKEAFNAYAYKLHSLGPLLYVAEVVLALTFLGHIFPALCVYLENRKSRTTQYQVVEDAGGPSYKTTSSLTMIITGVVIALFVTMHVWMFRIAPGGHIEDGYVTLIKGHEARDLHQWVTEWFSIPWVAFGYAGIMIFLGFHLRHAFWSAFQSLGLHHPKYTPVIYTIGVILAILLALGYIVLPIWIYLTGGSA